VEQRLNLDKETADEHGLKTRFLSAQIRDIRGKFHSGSDRFLPADGADGIVEIIVIIRG
jgi:hypothetical protein